MTEIMSLKIRGPASATVIDVVIPVHNEERDLEFSVRRLRKYLDERFPFEAVITIVDNASSDDTWRIASALAEELPGVRGLYLDRAGKGRAIRKAWSESTAQVVAYMDVDLATDLDSASSARGPATFGPQ